MSSSDDQSPQEKKQICDSIMSSSDDQSPQQEKKQISSSDDPLPPQEKKQMSSSDDQSPQEKKQKLEKDDDFFIPHYDRETYYKKLNEHRIFDDEKDIMSDSDSDFTEEEAKIYFDSLEASDGFDVPEFPKVSLCGLITPMSVDEDSLESLLHFSRAAIDTFNKENGTKYKVVGVEKTMQQAARGLNHYITFLAKIDDHDTTKTFEALVLMGIPEKKGDDATEVIFCREKVAKKVAAEEKLENEDGDSGSVEEEEEEEEVEDKKMDEFVGA